MKTNIVIPKKIKVGYQKRSDTYTKMLAYVIYYDNKNVLRKETSWQGWRDKTIDPNDFDNTPIEGFVLNKKAGGGSSGWNHRQTYCRVYDPRGFEFEITISNLLYILENTSSFKGKGLEGKLVYGWDGKDLVLIPEGSPEYTDMVEFNENLTKKVLKKDLVPGKTYLTSQNTKLVYLGCFDEYETSNWKNKDKENPFKNKGKRFWFLSSSVITNYKGISTLSSLSSILKVTDDDIIEDYAQIMLDLEHNPRYSPYDPSIYTYRDLTELEKTDFIKGDTDTWRTPYGEYYLLINGEHKKIYLNKHAKYDNDLRKHSYVINLKLLEYYTETRYYKPYETSRYVKIDNKEFSSWEELLNNYSLKKQVKYLKNGKDAK